jgi:N5-(carboxyethyl)ornithine synthase
VPDSPVRAGARIRGNTWKDTSVKIGFPIPRKPGERRRAILPFQVAALKTPGELIFETGYGDILGVDDGVYRQAGAMVADRASVCACPFICNPKPVLTDEYLVRGKTLFGWIHAVQGRAITDVLVAREMTAIAWEDMYEADRHCFWRNNEIAGEAAVVHALLEWGRLPYECRVAVVGRGNVARGAVRMLERYGCRTIVYDRKTSPLLREEIGRFDIVVNAVLWDVFRTDHLVYEADLARMKPGSLIVDISCDPHMGVESSRATTMAEPVYWHQGILHYAVDNTPSLFFRSASECIGEKLVPFLDDVVRGRANDVLERATVIRHGRILDERIRRFQNRV